LEAFVHKLKRIKTRVCIVGARASVRRTLLAAGLHEPEVLYANTIADARRRVSVVAGSREVLTQDRRSPIHAEV
jgi:SulP family sulfate permease